jgi:hypothetical protein
MHIPKHNRHESAALHAAAYFVKWNTMLNPLTPELNLPAQRCLTRFFTGDFAF